jgi:uncharacterized RDD family membrane protein YckC
MSAAVAGRPGTIASSPAPFAGAVSRTVAYLLDALVISIASAGMVAAMGMVASVVGSEARDLARALAAAYIVVLPALFAVYCAVFWVLAGRTPGMALVGVRVVATAGGTVRWLPALIRAVLLAFFPIGSLWLLVDRRHQAVHDKLARTVVIRA